MPWNEKSLRLRAARDRLHQKGQWEPTLIQKITLIAEILGMVHSPRNLSYCRTETAKVRAQYPEMTVDQMERFAWLEDRIARKAEMIRARQEKKKTSKRAPKPQPAPAQPSLDVW